MIERLIERAARRAARRLLLDARGMALRLRHRRPRPAVRPATDRVRRIAAIRLDRLGDLVLTLPALDDLAASYTRAELVAFVRPALAPLLAGRASVQRVIEVPREDDRNSLASRIAAVDADLAVDFSLEDDLLAARALASAGVPVRVGLAGGGREVFFTETASVRGDRLSLPAINARLVAAAAATPSHARPAHDIPPEEDREAENLLNRLGTPPGQPRIAVHPGGHHPSQRWPVERFAGAARALARRCGGKVVILGGPDDVGLVAALEELLVPAPVTVGAAGLRVLAAVMGRCDLLLANNSGPLHLAGAVGLPTVSVMGPTDPQRFWPQGIDQVVVRRWELICSPCTRGRCAPHDCLVGISAAEVVRAAESLLERIHPREDRATREARG